jgi:hypothetical protein
MIGKTVSAVLAVILAVLVTTSTAWSSRDFLDRHRGGFVKPCSLDGVNPVYHPDIFGNPAFARFYYGFVRAPDGGWQVIPGCHIP